MRPLKVVTCRRHNPTLGFPQHFLVIINPAQEPGSGQVQVQQTDKFAHIGSVRESVCSQA